jgi:hypothetical protein
VGAVGPRNGFARESASGNVEDAALTRHQREQISVRLLRPDFVDNVLGKGWGGDEKQDSGKDLAVNSHRQVRSKKNQAARKSNHKLGQSASLVRTISTEMRDGRKIESSRGPMIWD